jgi:hypothetical protein
MHNYPDIRVGTKFLCVKSETMNSNKPFLIQDKIYEVTSVYPDKSFCITSEFTKNHYFSSSFTFTWFILL